MEHYPPEVYDAYKKMIPGSYKTDFFRLSFLYINGEIC